MQVTYERKLKYSNEHTDYCVINSVEVKTGEVKNKTG